MTKRFCDKCGREMTHLKDMSIVVKKEKYDVRIQILTTSVDVCGQCLKKVVLNSLRKD